MDAESRSFEIDRTDYEFKNLDLSGNDFSKYNLKNARFIDCNIQGATFEKACLDGAKFSKCNLTESTFEDCSADNAKFSTCNFSDTIFENVILTRVEFNDCLFFQTKFISVNLGLADFFSGWIIGASFEKCEGTKIRLRSLIATNLIIKDSQFPEIDITDIDVLNSQVIKNNIFKDANIKMSQFSDVHLVNNNFHGSCWEDFRSENSSFSDCVFVDSAFDAVKITSARIIKCFLRDSNWKRSIFSDCSVIETGLQSAEFFVCVFKKLTYPEDGSFGFDLDETKFKSCDFKDSSLSKAINLSEVDFELSRFFAKKHLNDILRLKCRVPAKSRKHQDLLCDIYDNFSVADRDDFLLYKRSLRKAGLLASRKLNYGIVSLISIAFASGFAFCYILQLFGIQ